MIPRDTMQQWIELSRRDDAFNHFVPSDLRVMLGEIDRQRRVIESLDSRIKALEAPLQPTAESR